MSGQTARLAHAEPNTYTTGAAIKGGQIVEGQVDGLAHPGSAGSTTVLGVAQIDAKPWVDPVGVDADGFDIVNASPLPVEVTVAFGRFVVTYAANCAFGKALKAAAAGAVTPWASGVDTADLIIGYCDEPGGVVIATKTTGLANISR